MATRTVRVEIPINSPDDMETLTDAVLARHAVLGAGSPLTGEVDMALLASQHSATVTKRAQGNARQGESEADTLEANTAMGTAPGQTIDTPGTVYHLTALVRDRLLFVHVGFEEELENYGFNVVIGNEGGIKTVSVEIPIDNSQKIEKLVDNIIARHTFLGAGSPLTGQVDTALLASQKLLAKTKRASAQLSHGNAQALMQQADLALGTEAGQTSKTPGTVYNLITRVRDRLLFVHDGLEEELSTYGFNVVISEGGTPLPPTLLSFLTAVTNQNVLQGFNISIRGFAGDEARIIWGDGNTSDITLDGTTQNIPYSYLTPGIYNIEVKGDHPERIIELLITHAALTSAQPANNLTALEILNLEYNPITNFTLPTALTGLNYVSFFQDALNVTTMNSLLQVVNGYNTSGGTLLLHGGTNASPTGTGNAAKNQLESRGWTVATN